jgi:hypothetical protein
VTAQLPFAFCFLVAVSAGGMVSLFRDDLRVLLSRDRGALLTLGLCLLGLYARLHHYALPAALVAGVAGALAVVFRVPSWFCEGGE